MSDVQEIDLRPLTSNGKVALTIRDYDTPDVVAVHDAFRGFCKAECNNNYTQGLKVLLKYYQDDFKFEFLADKINALDLEIQELKSKKVPKLAPKEKEDMF